MRQLSKEHIWWVAVAGCGMGCSGHPLTHTPLAHSLTRRLCQDVSFFTRLRYFEKKHLPSRLLWCIAPGRILPNWTWNIVGWCAWWWARLQTLTRHPYGTISYMGGTTKRMGWNLALSHAWKTVWQFAAFEGPRKCGRPGYTRETVLHKCFHPEKFWRLDILRECGCSKILCSSPYTINDEVNFFNFLVCALKGLPSDQQVLTCCPAKSSHPQQSLKSSHPQQPFKEQPSSAAFKEQPSSAAFREPSSAAFKEQPSSAAKVKEQPSSAAKVKEQPSSAAILLRGSHATQNSKFLVSILDFGGVKTSFTCFFGRDILREKCFQFLPVPDGESIWISRFFSRIHSLQKVLTIWLVVIPH